MFYINQFNKTLNWHKKMEIASAAGIKNEHLFTRQTITRP
jgi:hypothetical protein